MKVFSRYSPGVYGWRIVVLLLMGFLHFSTSAVDEQNICDAVLTQATAFLEAGDVSAATAVLQKAVQCSTRFEYSNALGFIALSQKDLVRSFDYFKKAAEKIPSGHPSEHLVYYNLGFCASQHGDYENARLYYEKSISLKPDFAQGFYNLGLVFLHQGDSAKASFHLKKAEELFLQSGNQELSNAAKGLILSLGVFNEDQPEEGGILSSGEASQPRGNDAVTLNTDESPQENTVSLLEKSSLLFRDGSFPEAQAVLEDVIRKDPYCVQAYYRLGLVRISQNDYQGAIGYFEKVLALDPQFSRAYVNLGVIYSKLAKPEQAFEYFKKAYALEPNNPKVVYDLAVLYQKMGQYEHAKNFFKTAVQCATQEGNNEIIEKSSRALSALQAVPENQ